MWWTENDQQIIFKALNVLPMSNSNLIFFFCLIHKVEFILYILIYEWRSSFTMIPHETMLE